MERLQLVIPMSLVATLSFGCTEVPSDAPAGAQRVTIQPLPADQPRLEYSGIDSRQRLVIRDGATWEAVWQQAMGRFEPFRTAPEIDFESELVIVAAMGTRNTTDYAIDIDEVQTMDGDAWVSVTESAPGQRCATGDAITAPVTMIALPRYKGQTTFVEHAVTVDCK